jgi:hypothetical protein
LYKYFFYITEEKAGNHMMMASTHWKIERILAVSMLGIMPASVYFGGPAIINLNWKFSQLRISRVDHMVVGFIFIIYYLRYL